VLVVLGSDDLCQFFRGDVSPGWLGCAFAKIAGVLFVEPGTPVSRFGDIRGGNLVPEDLVLASSLARDVH
jgi:hypothetical protein